MGSIVGGLYAIGYTPEQIEQEITQADWDDLLDQKPQRKYEPMGLKDYPQRHLTTLGFSDWQVSLPSGINNANKLYRKLETVTIGFHGERNFMEFPRGYICIAADLHSGEKIIFNQGSLPDAMRASMSIPSMFSPHKYKGMTLVDGGTINNFPTDELAKLGCDIIIGVDLQSDISDTNNVSLTKVLEKTAMFINNRDNADRRALCNILVLPDLTGFTSQDFAKGAGLIRQGEKAARMHMEALVALAQQLKSYAPTTVKKFNKKDTLNITGVDVKGLKWVSRKYVLGTLDINTNEPTAVSTIESSMSALYGSNYFDKVSYNVISNGDPDSSYTLVVKLGENKNDLDIGVGLHHDPDYGTSFLINLFARNALIKGSRFSFDMVLAPNSRFRLLYEVDRGLRPGFGMRSDLYLPQPKLYDGNKKYQGQYAYTSSTTAVYGLVSLNNIASFRLGMEYNYSLVDLKDVVKLREILDPDGQNPNATKFYFNVLNLFAEFSYDDQDNLNFPTKGHEAYLIARYHGEFENYLDQLYDVNYLTVYLRYKAALSATNWLTFLPRIDAGSSFFGASDFPYLFHLGGLGQNYFNYQIPFTGYHYMEINGIANIASAQLEIRSRLFNNNYLSVLGGYALYANNFQDFSFNPDGNALSGVGVKYAIDTFFGPIALTAHKSLISGHEWLFYFNLGYWF